MGATLGRGASVGVIEGVTGEGVIVDVGIGVTVRLGLAVWDGVVEGKMTCVVAGAQAFRRRVIKINKKVFSMWAQC